jgi:hypothetical protein
MWMLVDATAILLFLGDLFATLRMLWLNFRSFEEVTLYWPETERARCVCHLAEIPSVLGVVLIPNWRLGFILIKTM